MVFCSEERRIAVRTVLVCVRTSRAAQNIVAAAARLGVTAAVRTAVSELDVLRQLSERPADLVLADTATTRPDTVGFTQRVLGRAPGAVIVLFGSEDARTAAAAVAAGARGLIQGGDHDLVSVVAKALLLLCVSGRQPAAMAGLSAGGVAAESPPGAAGTPLGAVRLPGPAPHRPPGPGRHDPVPAVVPAQRGDEGTGLDLRGGADPRYGPLPDPRDNTVAGRFAVAEPVGRRSALTERELQVLRGMADGKSNAEIGRELFVSEDTVKTHARRLFRKLAARDRAHAVAVGFRSGLVV
jgi:DNA-binding NarL/FixJ family response regulator